MPVDCDADQGQGSDCLYASGYLLSLDCCTPAVDGGNTGEGSVRFLERGQALNRETECIYLTVGMIWRYISIG
jgi:hypothetical protein